MKDWHGKTGRRQFLRSAGVVGASLAVVPGAPSALSEREPVRRNIKLGFDNFSVRAMKWNASQLLDYAATLDVDSVLFSSLGVYDGFDEGYLRGLKERADGLGIDVQVGTTCICPTSSVFKDDYGTAEEHLALAIRVAKSLGSPVARCYLGHGGDRKGEGGIERHIETTVEVCKKVRDLAMESNVKIAIENHAGDMQARELVALIEAAGRDYVGATLDAGNATWTIEDPLTALEILGPYVATTGIRDSAVWEIDKGATVQWTNMGDGSIDWRVYVDRFSELCPSATFQLEIISGGPRNLEYFEPGFWDVYPRARASDFARFVALAKRGHPPTPPDDRPVGDNGDETAQLQQRFDLERSIAYCREVLALGVRQ